MKLPFISLVVVNYNGKDIMKKCLPSLLKVHYPKDKYEIIVVDNASTDGSLEVIKSYFKVKIIKNKTNMGYVGVNSCLNKVKGKYIFILNNDIEMHKDCLKEIAYVVEKDNTMGVIAPKFVNYFSRHMESSGTWVSRSFYTGHYIDKKEKQTVKEVPYIGTEFIRTSVAKKFGYIYDKDYFIYAEDLDLSLRFRLLGYKTIFVPKAIIYHMHAATTKKSKSHKMTFLLERNLLMTYLKILSWGNIVLFLPYVLGVRFVAIIKDLISLNFLSALHRIKAILWIIFNFRLIMKKRRKIQNIRKVNDKELLKIFSEKHLFRKKALL